MVCHVQISSVYSYSAISKVCLCIDDAIFLQYARVFIEFSMSWSLETIIYVSIVKYRYVKMLEMSTIKTTRLIVHRNNTCKVPLVSSPFLWKLQQYSMYKKIYKFVLSDIRLMDLERIILKGRHDYTTLQY